MTGAVAGHQAILRPAVEQRPEEPGFNILIVEDDEAITELVTYHLVHEGFKVFRSADGEAGLALARELKPDLMILDWMLPGMSGIEVCRSLRAGRTTAQLPIVMLTGRASEPDRVRGLEVGADDYVTKPFSPRELVARIRAVLRHRRPSVLKSSFAYAGLVMDIVSRRVTRDGVPIALGPTEFRLLRHFLEQPGRVFSRKQLFFSVWSASNAVEERTVDAYIRRLRKAINGNGAVDLIRTVRYAGYALDCPPDPEPLGISLSPTPPDPTPPSSPAPHHHSSRGLAPEV